MLHSPTGGPAFPTGESNPNKLKQFYMGMSIRDYFAGQVLASLAGRYDWTRNIDAAKDPVQCASLITKEAYLIADAMIQEGQKPCRPSQDDNI